MNLNSATAIQRGIAAVDAQQTGMGQLHEMVNRQFEKENDRQEREDRRTALLREAATAIERSSTDLEMAFGMCHATLELDALASRIRKELGDG